MNSSQKDKKPVYVFVAGIILVTAIIIAVFYNLYQVSRDNLISVWNNNTMQMSQEIEYYLGTPRDAVAFTSQQVEEMMADGCSNSEIGEFLIDETSVFATLIESNTTGVYGYCRGEYLDGSGWIPPEGYVATSRPWYTAALDADGEVVFVKPYMNAQTGTPTMSVSKLLEDKESVISMDIYLDSIQRLSENMLISGSIDKAMVVDRSGMIVAHSDSSEVGKEYLADGNEYEKRLVKAAFANRGGVSTIDGSMGKELVFCRQINNEWCSVIILDEKEVLGKIQYIYLVSSAVLVIILVIFFIIFSIYNRKNMEAFELASEIGAISDIYSTMELIDLESGITKPIRSGLDNINALGTKGIGMNATGKEIAEMIASESSRSMLEQFLDMNTLKERMGNLKTISHEYVDKQGKWNRTHFIEMDRDDDGKISKVIWAIQSIDEDKKRQEMFKKLSETDGLTGILNRSGGEGRVFELLEEGKKGMLLVLDADHFKYVNDTYGHDMGDKVIISLACTLKETFRDADVVYRMGGDEFVVFAGGVDNKEIGRLVAGRLFERLSKVSFEGMDDWKLQVSVGAVLCDETNKEPFSMLLQQADKAMYESKQHKGNHMTFA